ncbi:MAG: hypothetical protein ACKOQT_12660, partial [Acidimicrobiaceae bacterium]
MIKTIASGFAATTSPTSASNVVEQVLTAAGVEIKGTKIYDPKATTCDAEVGEVVAANPDAIVLITFDEGSRILR